MSVGQRWYRETEVVRVKPAPMPPLAPKMSLDVTRDWTWISGVSSRRLAAWPKIKTFCYSANIELQVWWFTEESNDAGWAELGPLCPPNRVQQKYYRSWVHVDQCCRQGPMYSRLCRILRSWLSIHRWLRLPFLATARRRGGRPFSTVIVPKEGKCIRFMGRQAGSGGRLAIPNVSYGNVAQIPTHVVDHVWWERESGQFLKLRWKNIRLFYVCESLFLGF
jgi:hypothetical protein